MEQPQSKRNRRTSLEIKQLLKDFTRSGISAKEFCKAQGISTGVFYKWRSRYGAKPAAKPGAFIKLNVPTVPEQQPALFAEVKEIKIYQVVSASFLKELLA